jgi:hypothetical protein
MVSFSGQIRLLMVRGFRIGIGPTAHHPTRIAVRLLASGRLRVIRPSVAVNRYPDRSAAPQRVADQPYGLYRPSSGRPTSPLGDAAAQAPPRTWISGPRLVRTASSSRFRQERRRDLSLPHLRASHPCLDHTSDPSCDIKREQGRHRHFQMIRIGTRLGALRAPSL